MPSFKEFGHYMVSILRKSESYLLSRSARVLQSEKDSLLLRNNTLEEKILELEHLATEMPEFHSRLVAAEDRVRELNLSQFNQRVFEILALKEVRLSVQELVSVLRGIKSQLGQDFLALVLADFKTSGYFVEIGATDGITISNSYALETMFNWQGILAEPARIWQSKLHENRGCVIDERCVWSKSKKHLAFLESGEFSTIEEFRALDMHASERSNGIQYEVETVSLMDLLKDHEAPKFIDFLSIDTEGSEFEILKDFDFSKYSFALISVEHNFSVSEEAVSDLLTKNGYTRILREFSEWDAWYVPSVGMLQGARLG